MVLGRVQLVLAQLLALLGRRVRVWREGRLLVLVLGISFSVFVVDGSCAEKDWK